jgi:transcriptional regulator with XRE-family HTH domain
MGSKVRPKPDRLAEKLVQIRERLGLSQSEMVARMQLQDVIAYNKISDYERATREPTLPILLKYAQAAGVCVDVLIDDELELPAKLPSTPIHPATHTHSASKQPQAKRRRK